MLVGKQTFVGIIIGVLVICALVAAVWGRQAGQDMFSNMACGAMAVFVFVSLIALAILICIARQTAAWIGIAVLVFLGFIGLAHAFGKIQTARSERDTKAQAMRQQSDNAQQQKLDAKRQEEVVRNIYGILAGRIRNPLHRSLTEPETASKARIQELAARTMKRQGTSLTMEETLSVAGLGPWAIALYRGCLLEEACRSTAEFLAASRLLDYWDSHVDFALAAFEGVADNLDSAPILISSVGNAGVHAPISRDPYPQPMVAPRGVTASARRTDKSPDLPAATSRPVGAVIPTEPRTQCVQSPWHAGPSTNSRSLSEGKEYDMVEAIVPDVDDHEVTVEAMMKREGESIGAGEVLYLLRGREGYIEIEADCSGTIVRWFVLAGHVVRSGDPIVRIRLT